MLITGASGLLGAHLAAAMTADYEVVGTDRHPWWGDVPIRLLQGELGDADFRRALMAEARPQVVIHCAGVVNVDLCEDNPVLAYAINGAVTGHLARLLPAGGLFVYVTTDGIFDGNVPMATEQRLPCPRTVYGRSKLHGEWETLLGAPNHLVIRTNFYGWSSGRKPTAGEWLFGALTVQEPITLFDDFHFTPLYVGDLVDRMCALIESEHRGIFHVGGADRVSKHAFGLMMAEAAGLAATHVTAGSMDSAGFRAQRPKDMSLDSRRLADALNRPSPPVMDGLRRFIADRQRPLSIRARRRS
ncbi:MAG: NAD(P)-dependent oxidoreductase [Acidimicrobiia bacterium]